MLGRTWVHVERTVGSPQSRQTAGARLEQSGLLEGLTLSTTFRRYHHLFHSNLSGAGSQSVHHFHYGWSQRHLRDAMARHPMMYRITAQTTYLMPTLIATFALNFQQGIGLYWVTQSLVMVIQVFSMMGCGGLQVPPWFPGAGWRPGDTR